MKLKSVIQLAAVLGCYGAITAVTLSAKSDLVRQMGYLWMIAIGGMAVETGGKILLKRQRKGVEAEMHR